MGVTAEDVKCQLQSMFFRQETLMGYLSAFIDNRKNPLKNYFYPKISNTFVIRKSYLTA